MAGIEKVCEFSGEYPGWLMYGYKRNHIQIMPKHRKEFRGKHAVLYIQRKDHVLGAYVARKGGWCYHLNREEYKDRIVIVNGKKYDRVNDRGNAWHPVSISKEFWYALVVPDLPGDVHGVYSNHSCNISAVKRRLKRMLRCKKLEVRYVDVLEDIPESL